jgi:AcrR family transcriptional regulator
MPPSAGAALEAAILEAAWAMRIEAGYEGFTFEAVAERAATSRPVISRRWPQRDALLLAAVGQHWQTHLIDQPDTGNLRDDALAFLRNANATGRTRPH